MAMSRRTEQKGLSLERHWNDLSLEETTQRSVTRKTTQIYFGEDYTESVSGTTAQKYVSWKTAVKQNGPDSRMICLWAVYRKTTKTCMHLERRQRSASGRLWEDNEDRHASGKRAERSVSEKKAKISVSDQKSES